MTLGHAFAVLGRKQVDGALAGDAEHGAVAGEDVQATAGRDDLVVAAEEFEVEVALVVDVRDDQANFVDVAGEHQRRAAVALEHRDAVAQRVLEYLSADFSTCASITFWAANSWPVGDFASSSSFRNSG
jgi:hypothetical protein